MLAATVLLILVRSSAAETIAGHARVIDGDTIEIGGERIQILDIDAPEMPQLCEGGDGVVYRCGEKAMRDLARWIGTQVVTCETLRGTAQLSYLARCVAGDSDVAAWLAESGLAVPGRDCKCEVVREAADRAKAAKRGLWAGPFDLPWAWRENH